MSETQRTHQGRQRRRRGDISRGAARATNAPPPRSVRLARARALHDRRDTCPAAPAAIPLTVGSAARERRMKVRNRPLLRRSPWQPQALRHGRRAPLASETRSRSGKNAARTASVNTRRSRAAARAPVRVRALRRSRMQRGSPRRSGNVRRRSSRARRDGRARNVDGGEHSGDRPRRSRSARYASLENIADGKNDPNEPFFLPHLQNRCAI